MLSNMKAKHRLINFLLVVSLMGAIALTASSYVGCGSFEDDEFLDLSLSSKLPLSPILALRRKSAPRPLRFLRILLLFLEPDLHTDCLRC